MGELTAYIFMFSKSIRIVPIQEIVKLSDEYAFSSRIIAISLAGDIR